MDVAQCYFSPHKYICSSKNVERKMEMQNLVEPYIPILSEYGDVGTAIAWLFPIRFANNPAGTNIERLYSSPVMGLERV